MHITRGISKVTPIPILLRILSIVALFGLVLAQTPAQDVQAQSGEPQLILTKSIEGGATTAQVGDVIRYRIRFECSSLTTSCGVMQITDVLQAGLEYQEPPSSSVPSGFSIAYNSGTRTITITKNDNNLLDGSQYDAVIAVKVNYDLRPVPATINNTINGRIDPPGPVSWQTATPAHAPPITVGAVSPSWAVTKTRVSPAIEPTVDTDVTYQLNLCPATPPAGMGVAALEDIVLTDTLPSGAVFVSATDLGVYDAGTGVVTWPTVPGPTYPPNCITRYVTIRYPSPTFSIGSEITNTAGATADYVPPSGGTCVTPCFTAAPAPLTHDIIPIQDVPTYNKSDAGDPVGFTGTARFILNLNTNGTNYPANAVTLIDNLPPQLQAASITSGEWDAEFDYVRAYVEYSTNNGSAWTAFPGQPVSYNTDATYNAPVANITNVRWRFEYDLDGDGTYTPGLPYMWEFSDEPEVRVIPRQTATTADPPSGAAMPAATVGSTYYNCVRVTRENASGPVSDPCRNTDMTVRGDYVSLRATKGETPGASWDEWEDPLINSFVSDATILPGDTLRYTLTVDMTERSSIDLVNPVILETLPSDLIFVRNGIAELDGVTLATQPTFTRSGPNPGSGQTLKWDFSGLTIPKQALGSHLLKVEFFARIPPGQSYGARTNTLYVVTDSADVLCEVGTQVQDNANGDIDTDADATDPACRNTDTYVVERSAALRGEKWIRSVAAENITVINKDTFLPDAACPNGGTSGLGTSTNPFTRYPCISQAFPEGSLSSTQYVPPPTSTELDDFEYNLRIFNDGNVPMRDYVLYDILPYYGDKGSGGTLANSARSSEFRPVLRGPLQFLGGSGLAAGNFTIEYNLTTNPCRPEVFNENPGLLIPTSCDNTWVSTVADWSTVRSYRIRLNSGSVILPYTSAANLVRFGVPMSIPKDSPLVGTFNNDDAQSREIAWNSFSHIGSYETGIPAEPIRDLLASEPRKVGITIPERLSIGNRVWRDSDNSGDINEPDDTNPGIPNVTVALYAGVDAGGDGIPDNLTPIATTTTDSGGYYLFSNLPAGNYIVGIPSSNFNTGQPLNNLRSSTGTPTSTTYTTPADGNVDMEDHGRDPASVGQAVYSPIIPLVRLTEEEDETDLSANDRDGPADTRRGLNGETDNNSDLTVDFGFFGGTDVPFSIGNQLWKDDGSGSGGILNNGIRDGTEPVVVGARVYLYRDGNNNGTPDAGEKILSRSDVTDAGGFYLFDNLDPGTYFVQVDSSNFAPDPDGAGPLTAGVLAGWYSSQPTGWETVGVSGGTTTAALDNDDNGVNTETPEARGVFSRPVVLTRGTSEPLGESPLSSDSSSAPGFNPTAGDGPAHIGRFGETDANSNMTIDFGFIPPMSLGNRVWIDQTTGTMTGYNNGVMDAGELGVEGVRVELWRDADGNSTLESSEFIRAVVTDSSGYYLFDYLQPGSNYYIHIPDDNFGDVGVGDLVTGDPLENYVSSYDRTPPADDTTDINDNGVDDDTPDLDGITSQPIAMIYSNEPTSATESDLSPNTTLYGTNNVGRFGQTDSNSNLTMDFGFVYPPRSLGNYLWLDTGGGTPANVNNGIFDTGESPVPSGVRVNLYRDTDGNGQPDDLGAVGVTTDDWLLWDTTDANGYYLFDNLQPGRYLVGVDGDNFDAGGAYSGLVGYTSSTGNVANATNNLDSRDNGIDRSNPATAASPYGILSTSIDLTALPLTGMPTGETGLSSDTGATLGNNPTADDGPDSRGRYGETNENSDLTIDFGFVEAYALGNRVWFDTNNDGDMDAGELPLQGVQVALYHTAGGNPTTPVMADGVARTAVTNAGGYYLFDYLAPGEYVVVITADNFNASGTYNALVGYWSSRTTLSATGTVTENVDDTPDPDSNGADSTPNTGDDDVDIDDNGTRSALAGFVGAVVSKPVTVGLTGATEPTNETDLDGGSQGNQANGRANMKVDFGFYRTEIGNLVYRDANLNGTYDDGAGSLLDGVTVRLYAQDGATEIRVGPDGILGTTDDATGGVVTGPLAISHPAWGAGEYYFSGLPEGDYIVRVSGPSGMLSTIDTNPQNDNDDPDIHADNNDNGDGVGAGTVSAEILTMDAGEFGASATATTTDNTVDFGFVDAYSLGNRVWFDTNNNSAIDGTELGAANIIVELFRAGDDPTTDTPVATDVTNGSGYYLFDNLYPGDYFVVIPSRNFNGSGAGEGNLEGYWSSATTLLNGATPSTTETPAANADTVPSDLDDNGTLQAADYVSSAVVTLGPTGLTEPTLETQLEAGVGDGTPPDGRANMTVDFGFYRVEIGNLVFSDNDASGHYNTGDTPTNDIPVRLYDSAGNEVRVGPDGIFGTVDDAVNGVVTGPNADHPLWAAGEYHFSGLPAGDYVVRATLPTDTFSTVDVSAAVPNSQNDNDNPNTNVDNNDNGDGVAGGTASFEAGDTLTMNPGTDAAKPNRTVSNATGTTTDNTIDFGYVELVALGNRVWLDTGATTGHTNNGILDTDEAGIDGVTVELHGFGLDGIEGTADDINQSVPTSGGGYYKFDNLWPGIYYVQIPATMFDTTLPSPLLGHVSTIGNGGVNDDDDQTADENGIDPLSPNTPVTSGVRSPNYTLTPNLEPSGEDQSNYPPGILDDNNVNFTADFGFVEAYALGNRVWFDTNNDGDMDAGEQPIDGVEVALYRANASGNPSGTALATDETANGGYYLFDYLAPGEYVVVVTADNFNSGGTYNALVGYWSSRTTISATGAPTENVADTPDPDDDNGTPADPTDDDDDQDDNGTRSALAGFVGAVVSKPVTLGANGETEPTSGETGKEVGVVDGNQPDGRSNLKVDFGFYRTEIGNLVFEDANGNGTYNIADGDLRLSGVTVRLFAQNNTSEIITGADGILGTADDALGGAVITDINGEYRFSGLPAGDYIVKVVTPAGMTSTVDSFNPADSSNPDTNIDNNDNGIGLGGGTVTSNTANRLTTNPGSTGAGGINTVDQSTGTTTDLTLDFGFVYGYSLGNRVWFDTDNDGILDGGEVGVNDVLVELYRDDGTTTGSYDAGDSWVASTTTAAIGGANGYYRFDSLFPGEYVVVIPNDNFTVGGTTNALVGYWSTGTSIAGGAISELATNDPDNNLDASITVVSGDDNGETYLVGATHSIDYVASYAVTLGGSAEPTGEDNPLPNTDTADGETPADNRSNRTVDFGFYRVAIGDLVFSDNDISGDANAGDTPLADVIVRLFNGATEIITGRDGILGTADDTWGPDGILGGASTDDGDGGMPTNASGNYLFSGLPAGDYTVRVETPEGAVSTVDTADTADSLDPDTHTNNNDNGDDSLTAGGLDRSNVLTMNGGEFGMFDNASGTTTDTTVDFGYLIIYSLGNRVWSDTDGDGIIDAGEPGINGVTVNLYRDANNDDIPDDIDSSGTVNAGDVLATDITAASGGANGYYRFDGLYTGSYIVEVVPPVGYISTTDTGINPDTDADDNDDNGVVPSGDNIRSNHVTLGGTEPSTDNDPVPNPDTADGEAVNIRSNRTVDFGFVEAYSLGNRVWLDDGAGANSNNGIRDADEVDAGGILNGTTVNLYRASAPSVIFRTTTTDANGYYRFDNLASGDYIVEVVPPAGYSSSTVDAANPNTDVDDDDNGVTLSGNNIRSNLVTLGGATPEPTGELNPATNPTLDGEAPDARSNRTVDFGIIPVFSLGNRVWFDTDNNRVIDFDSTGHPADPTYLEVGINGVELEVYAADVSGNPTGPVLGTTSTVNGGYYLFNPLPAGNYVVVVTADNFTSGALQGYWSSGISRADNGDLAEIASDDPDNNRDSDDNGMYRAVEGDVISKPVTLGPNPPSEPMDDDDLNTSLTDPDDQGQPDNRGNMSVDFGFYTMEIGNLVWNDLDNNGNTANTATPPATESGMPNVNVQLWSGDGSRMLAAATTSASGTYSFDGLPQGNYLLRIPHTEFTTTLLNYISSTGTNSTAYPVAMGPNEPAPDPDNPLYEIDSDDNGTEKGGTLELGGYIESEVVTLSPTAEASYNNASGSTLEPRVDFGVFRQDAHNPLIGIAKVLIGTPAEVSPGTYQVIYDIYVENMGDTPLNDVQVTDDLSATFTAPTTASVVGLSAVGLSVDPTYNGSGNLLTGLDTLAVGASGTIRLTLNVVPYAAGPFNNTAIASGTNPFGGATVTDRSQDGTDPDPDGDDNPTNNEDPTPVTFGPNLFDPPIGIKVFNDAGLPLLQWTMVWINSTNIAAVNARVSDPIPAGTTYVASGAASGYAVPIGAPSRSTNIGVSCTSPGAATTTTLCYYEGPTPGNLRGRIVWEGTLGPDFGRTTAAAARNELYITFRVNVPTGVNAVYNVASIDADRNGDRLFLAGGGAVLSDLTVARSQGIWLLQTGEGGLNGRERSAASSLPATGFAPNVVTALPQQPASKAYTETGGVTIEIPKLGIDTSVTGIPQAEDGTWDVTWLWNQTGWLQGTAYPTTEGNSAITGHVYLPNGEPGIFVDAHTLAYGDKIILHAYGQKFTYEVRENAQVKPDDVTALNRRDGTWVTLITCRDYIEESNTYASRVAVSAVLLTVETEETTSTANKER